MRTLLTIDPQEAAEFIKSGGIVAFPTETVYGLGANIFDERAIAKIFEAKKRPSDNPLIAHVASIEKIEGLAEEITQNARKFIDRFFPGPLTLVLPKAASVSLIATAGLDSVGIRMPAFDLAREFIAACGTSVAAPSANLSGKPSPTTWQAVAEDLDGSIDCILQGDPTEIGLESTVVDCSDDVPILLRMGAVSLEQLREVIPETRLHEPDDLLSAKSPGLRHKHYSPFAKVILVTPGQEIGADASAAYIGIDEIPGRFALTKICSSIDEYAHSLFEFFRECDRRHIEVIYCQGVSATGIGGALMDRLRRATE